MSTASNGNGHRGDGVVPLPDAAAPLLANGLEIAGSPLDVAELERLANEMFRAGPEGAGLGADEPPAAEASTGDAIRELPGALPAMNGRSADGAVGTPLEEEGLQWSHMVDGARVTPSGPTPALQPDPRAGRDVARARVAIPTADPRPETAPTRPMREVDLFALHGDPLSLADLGLAQAPRVSAAEPTEVSYYFIDESRSFARSRPTDDATLPASVASAGSAHPAFDVESVRREFPALASTCTVIALWCGWTTPRPPRSQRRSSPRLDYFYRHENSNIHRAAHTLAARATDAYEAARDKVARFLHALVQR